MKSPTPETLKSVFFRSNTLFVLLTLQMKYQAQSNHDTTFELLLTINFWNKYFDNSVDWSGLYLVLLTGSGLKWMVKFVKT